MENANLQQFFEIGSKYSDDNLNQVTKSRFLLSEQKTNRKRTEKDVENSCYVLQVIEKVAENQSRVAEKVAENDTLVIEIERRGIICSCNGDRKLVSKDFSTFASK